MIGPRGEYIDERFHTLPFEAAVRKVEITRTFIVDVKRDWRPRAAYEAGMTIWRRIGIDWFVPVANMHGVLGKHREVVRIDRGEGRVPMTLHPIKQHREAHPRDIWEVLPCGGNEDIIVTLTGDVFVGLFWRGNYEDAANETGDVTVRSIANSIHNDRVNAEAKARANK